MPRRGFSPRSNQLRISPVAQENGFFHIRLAGGMPAVERRDGARDAKRLLVHAPYLIWIFTLKT
ncbi:hypothetical protein GCM10025859_21330 [Alicyclobacillus fastidiosus]|nr:hypothetical protein GCM10025859_21330 [Alicyclobacillus fastidiosus]